MDLQPACFIKLFRQIKIQLRQTSYRLLFGSLVQEMHHFWTTQATADGLETKWAVAGRRHDGSVFALHWVDVAKLDAAGKLARLEVHFASK